MENNTTILICDDNSSLRMVMEFLFRKDGFRILTLPDGERLYSTARQELPTLILLDITMPGKDGISALEELGGDPHTASIPVIMISGVVTPEVVSRAKKLGAKEFIEKPFNSTELIETVRKYAGTGNKDIEPV